MSQNSLAYESDSEILAAFPQSTNSGKFKITCKVCGAIVRSESWSTISSEFTVDSREKSSRCFKFFPKRLKMRSNWFFQKTVYTDPNKTIHNNSQAVGSNDSANDIAASYVINYNHEVASNETKQSQKGFPSFSRLQKKIGKKKGKKSGKGKGLYISKDSDSGSSISGSSLVCIKDENDSSENNEVEIDEKKKVEEGIKNLMREHFEAINAAETQSRSHRHIIFRNIFSPKENNDRSIHCNNSFEKVEMESLNNGKLSDLTHKVHGDEEDEEEVRDKPTSLSPYAFNRERILQKNRTLTQQTLLKDGCKINNNSGRTDVKTYKRASSDGRHERRIQRRNNNIGVCNECKLRMIGSPLDVRSRTPSESHSSNTTMTDRVHTNHSTPLRSHSFKHSPMLHSLSVTRSSASRLRKNDVKSNSQHFIKRNNVNAVARGQAKSTQRGNIFMGRSSSVKSASPAAFRRTHSVRSPGDAPEAKTFTRRRTTTIGSFPGDVNYITSTVSNQIILGFSFYLFLVLLKLSYVQK